MARRVSINNKKLSSLLYFLIPVGLLAIALFSRLYDLSSWPYFHVGMPMCGGTDNGPNCTKNILPGFPGLYDDEAGNVQSSSSIVGIFSNFGGGSFAPFLIALSTRVLGGTVFTVRLPFAIVSSISAVLVYFTTKQIAGGSKTSGILSALYFTFMMPALVYGRMAFGENLIALFFMITFFSTLKIESELSSSRQCRLWFIVASVFSALSIIAKLSGIFVALYFVFFLYKSKLLRRGYPYVGLTAVLGVLLTFGVLQLVTGRAINILQAGVYPFFTQMGPQLALYRAFFLDSLPSGVPIFWASTTLQPGSGLVTPEFWYVFLYLALGALVFYNFKQYSDLFLAIGIFVVFVGVFSGPVGDYWMIMIQPLLAIAFWPGLKRLLQMPLAIALAFYTFLFLPLATSIGIFLIAPSLMGSTVIQNSTLFIWNLLVLMPPAALLLLTGRMHLSSPRWRTYVNGLLLAIFFIALIVATLFLPILYPYYI